MGGWEGGRVVICDTTICEVRPDHIYDPGITNTISNTISHYTTNTKLNTISQTLYQTIACMIPDAVVSPHSSTLPIPAPPYPLHDPTCNPIPSMTHTQPMLYFLLTVRIISYQYLYDLDLFTSVLHCCIECFEYTLYICGN